MSGPIPQLKPTVIIRKLELNDCEQVRDIWKEVNFYSSKYNFELMLNSDPNGFFVAQDQNTGQILGVLTGVNLSEDFAFVGSYAVRPQYQGLGIGQQLWAKMMEHIGNDRNISLFAAQRMEPIYSHKLGFVLMADRKIEFHFGKVVCDNLIKNIEGISLQHISLNKEIFDSVVQYDKEICDGLERRSLIDGYTKLPQTICLAAINKSDNKIVGYCIVTATSRGIAKAEPLYADNEQIAELLIGKCCKLVPISINIGFLFECWDSNTKAIDIAKKMGLSFTNKEPNLFTKKVVTGNLDKIFCVSSRGFYPF